MTAEVKVVPKVTSQLAEMQRSLPARVGEPLDALVERRLPGHVEAVACLTDSALEESCNVGSRTLDQFLAAVIAGLKERENAMKAEILQHPDFRALEQAHAAVEEQVFQQDGQGLRVRVCNLKPADIRRDQAEAGLVTSSRLYQALVREFHRPGGQPNRVVHLTHPVGPDDVDIIEPLLTMAEEAHFVLLTQARPEVVCPPDPVTDQPPADFSSLPEIPEVIRSEYGRLENAPLHGLQQHSPARRWLFAVGQTNGRKPYDPRTNPAPTAPELRESGGPLLLPGSLLAAKSIARAYTAAGNASRISGFHDGGRHTRPGVVTGDEVMVMDCVIDERQEKALHDCGIHCSLPWKGRDYAVSFDTPSAFVPVPTGDPEADADARLSSRLAYVLLECEMGHRLKRTLRYARGSAQDAETMQTLIEGQLKLLVTPDAKSASAASLARKPLKLVTVSVTETAPGAFVARARITPHTRMGEAHVTLELKAELSPSRQ